MATIRLVPRGPWFRHASAAGSREPDGGRQARPDPSHRLEQTSRRTEQGRVARFLAVTGGQCAAETMARSGYLSDAAQVTKRYMDRLAMRVPGPCDIFAWLTRECG